MPSSGNTHDPSYKLLFSHPEMIADLLRGYVHQSWVERLDFASLERVDGDYVTADLRERENDLVWRVLGRLIDWLAAPEQLQLRRHFAVWINRVLLQSRMPGISFDELIDLQEIDAMLSERVKDWTRDWKEQGLAEGRAEGRQEGIEQGVQHGERAVLMRQFTRRFGPLDAATLQRLNDADRTELERWADNILDATTLEEVFRS